MCYAEYPRWYSVIFCRRCCIMHARIGLEQASQRCVHVVAPVMYSPGDLTGSWSRGASRTKMKVLVLNIWSWSWSRSWGKSLAVFKTFVVILDGSVQGTPWMAFCERQQKQFAIWKPVFESSFCSPCTSASFERVFNNGGYLLGHTDASKA